MGDAGEMLDAQAKADYKRRTAELREQLEEARELNQLERVDQLEEEIEALAASFQERSGWAVVIGERPPLQSEPGST
jgi:hypothetical protein